MDKYEDAYFWEQRKLGEIGSTFTGLSGKTKEDFGHGDARFVTYMNVYSNSIADLSMTEHVEVDQTQNSVKYGDIFLQHLQKPQMRSECPLYGLEILKTHT